MNFIAAIQHASIGYGIRRKVWKRMLHLDQHELFWVDTATSAQLCGLSILDVSVEDIKATDWEAI